LVSYLIIYFCRKDKEFLAKFVVFYVKSSEKGMNYFSATPYNQLNVRKMMAEDFLACSLMAIKQMCNLSRKVFELKSQNLAT